jgi:hypothetical protein
VFKGLAAELLLNAAAGSCLVWSAGWPVLLFDMEESLGETLGLKHKKNTAPPITNTRAVTAENMANVLFSDDSTGDGGASSCSGAE